MKIPHCSARVRLSVIFLALAFINVQFSLAALVDGVVASYNTTQTSGNLLDAKGLYDFTQVNTVGYASTSIGGMRNTTGDTAYFKRSNVPFAPGTGDFSVAGCFQNVGSTGSEALVLMGGGYQGAETVAPNPPWCDASEQAWELSVGNTGKYSNVGCTSGAYLCLGTRTTGGGSSKVEVAYTPSAANNNPICIVGIRNSTTMRLYVNGVLNQSVETTVRTVSSTCANGANIGTGVDNSIGGTIGKITYWNRSLTSAEITQWYNAGQPLNYPFVVNQLVPGIVFNSPADQTSIFIGGNLTINTSSSNLGGTITTTHLLYNSTGALIGNNTAAQANYTSTFSGLAIGTYYINASASNTTQTNWTETRTIYIYNLSESITTPTPNQTLATRYLNITWAAGSFNPSAAPVSIVSYNVTLYNGTHCASLPGQGCDVKLLNTTTGTSFYWDIYSANLSVAEFKELYQIRVCALDSQGNSACDTHAVNITTNTIINVSAKRYGTNTPIMNFSGWIYSQGVNTTYSTTTGYALVDTIRGNLTIFAESPIYAVSNTTNYANLLINTSNASYQFSLYETNVMNITFYEERTYTLLSGPTISLDIIGTIASYTASTTNGTIYLSLLQPDTYTLRYAASGFSTRFYRFTIENRSFNALSLYLINSTYSNNISVYVVDEVTNPVEGATVKALKYDITTNTYRLQESALTDVSGKAILGLTKYDEFYKFVVEYEGETKKTTSPAYITTDSVNIQINLQSVIGQGFFDYQSIYYDLTFNTATNNFRLDFNDANGISSTYSLEVYAGNNFTKTLLNTSSLTASSGVILIPITPTNGTTYYAYAYYYPDGVKTSLAAKMYEVPSATIMGTYGVFLQILLTLAAACVALASTALAVILVPMSLIVGKIVGLNDFGMVSLIPMQVLGFVIAFVVSIKR